MLRTIYHASKRVTLQKLESCQILDLAMQKPTGRLQVIHGHLNPKSLSCSASATKPTVTVSPSTCLVDEKVHICVTGLSANQVVTLTSHVEEGRKKFEARGVYTAGKDGTVDNRLDQSAAGTFTGVKPMGLFWGLRPCPGFDPWLRLIKKDVTTPLTFTLSVYNGDHSHDEEIQEAPLSTAVVHRMYKSPSVRRIPVTEGPFTGTMFVPEGKGPFPALIDAYGGLVSLVETRAALLASHGYATFAFTYLYTGELAKYASDANPTYFKEAVEWFSQQDFVDEERFGAVGLCFGGFLLLTCAAICPKIKVIVNINGLPMVPSYIAKTIKTDHITDGFSPFWADPTKLFVTDEGLVIRDASDVEDAIPVPAWQHGAKILTITGEDDCQVNTKWHTFMRDSCPASYRGNVEVVRYPGAGHLIEPPYSPLCRVMNPGRDRLRFIGITQEELRDLKLVAGGYPEQHAQAQEDAWGKILDFLRKNLMDMNTDKNVNQNIPLE